MHTNKAFTASSSSSDLETVALERAAKAKEQAIAALVEAAHARKARGDDTYGIEQSIDLEQLTLSGYQLRIDQRKRELKAGRL